MAGYRHLNRFLRFCAFLPCVSLLALQFFRGTSSYAGGYFPDDSNLAYSFQAQNGDQSDVIIRPSYLTDPLNELIHNVPDLGTLRPNLDQSSLPMILQKVGEDVDAVFNRDFSDVSADEFVQVKEWQHSKEPGLLELHQESAYQAWDNHYTYYVTRKNSFLNAGFLEYRLDKRGKEPRPYGFFLSNGFASSVLYFAKSLQAESHFRYLGLARMDNHNTYVVAFAQTSGKATITVGMTTVNSSRFGPANNTTLLRQGIAWIDANSFQILKMRTILLGPAIRLSKDENLDDLQTIVNYALAQPEGLDRSLWLPIQATVLALFHEHYSDDTDGHPIFIPQQFEDFHRFTEYRVHRSPSELSVNLDESARNNDAAAHPYLELPLQELIKRVPDLKGIRAAPDQSGLAMILRNTGEAVDDFFSYLIDIIASEEITQERSAPAFLSGGMPAGTISKSEHVRDNYLIVHAAESAGRHINEFRMDARGNRLTALGIEKGFFVTSGYALSSIHFASASQGDSRFVQLGEQKVNDRDTYVMAFAQLPSQAHNPLSMVGDSDVSVHMLAQGIAWVDKSNFHILRMRTDLLAPQPEIGLEQQTTTINFAEVRFVDVAKPLWLPRDVHVYIKFGSDYEFVISPSVQPGEIFQNTHHYSNYRRYRVATKMVAPN
jgi:hypothetical protein